MLVLKVMSLELAKISRYDYLSHIPKYPEASKGYRYEIYTAAPGEYDKYTNRWKDEDQRIKSIVERISKREEWEDLLVGDQNTKALPYLRPGRGGIQSNDKVLPYRRDLGGLHIYGYSPKADNDILHYSNLDYCYFELCSFATEDEEVFTDALFYDSIIHHTRFERCTFINRNFSLGEIKYCVFSNCHFENFIFGRIPAGSYDNIIFSNCYFKNVNFRKVDLNNLCFSGTCTFENIHFNKEELARHSDPLGPTITAQLKEWDREAYRARRKSTADIHPNLKKRRYQSLLDAYLGLSAFYRAVSLMEDQNGFHKNYIDWQYLYNWTHGETRRLSSGPWPIVREFISRNLIGYGAKPERPIFAWLALNIIFSVLYLFSGINYASDVIQRSLSFDRSQLWDTITDYGICLYYSAITSTTVGYGDISPRIGISMFICSVHAVLGLLLITMFTVIFARRFFK